MTSIVPGLTAQLEEGIRMMDVGVAASSIGSPNCILTADMGMDFPPEAIENARSEAVQKGLRNTEFIIRDLSDFHESTEPEAFDFITTFDAIHDQAKPLNVLNGIHRALKADGVYLMSESELQRC